MQPTFAPWLGYFSLIQKVDLFVFLDSVQFDARSWQQRNRIIVNGKPNWITVPVTCPNGRSTLIKDVLINKEHYSGSKLTSQIKQNYSRTSGINELTESIFSYLNAPPVELSSLNIKLIRIISENLSIDTKFIRSSELDVRGTKADLLLDICRNQKATKYFSPPGSRDYLSDYDGFKNHGITLEYFQFDHPTYPQTSSEFIPNLSVIDSICNLGFENTHNLIVKGLK
jgi:hypothetical protein